MGSLAVFLDGAASIQLRALIQGVREQSSKTLVRCPCRSSLTHNAVPVSGLLSGNFVDEALCNETSSSRHAA